MKMMIMNFIFLRIMKMYFSNDDLQRPFGSISGILVFLVCWFEETLRGAKITQLQYTGRRQPDSPK